MDNESSASSIVPKAVLNGIVVVCTPAAVPRRLWRVVLAALGIDKVVVRSVAVVAGLEIAGRVNNSLRDLTLVEDDGGDTLTSSEFLESAKSINLTVR